MAAHFRVTGHFEISTSAPNDPKMTLNTKRSKIRHIHVHVTTTPDSQMSLCFALWPASFELIVRPFWDKCAQKPPKWPWTLKGQGCPIYIYMLEVPPSPKFHCFALRLAVSEILAIFHVSIGHNVKFQDFFFKFKFEISNFQEATFVWIVTWNIQKKFGWKRIKTVGVAFWNFHSHRVPC